MKPQSILGRLNKVIAATFRLGAFLDTYGSQMLPRPRMLTIKNRASWKKRLARCALCLPIILLFSACTPAGPKNLLEGKKLIDKGKYSQAIERLTNCVSIHGTNA